MIPANICGQRHRIAAVYDSLRRFRFGVSVEALGADVRDTVGLELHGKTLQRDLRLLHYMGLARLSREGGRKTWLAVRASRPELPPVPAGQSEVAEGARRLSPRQLEIVRRLAAGQSSGEIAAALGVRATTVDTQRSRIRRRLGLHSSDALMRFALLASNVPATAGKAGAA